MRVIDLRGEAAPAERSRISVCPHCWGVNPWADRLCARCGADMRLTLQESGGLRRTAPVQSPVPVSGGPRLSLLQRMLLFCFLALLIVSQVLGAIYATAARPASPLPQPASAGVIPADVD